MRDNDYPDEMDTKQAEKFLRLSEGTLKVWRCRDMHNIPYMRIGSKIIYEKDELIIWRNACKVNYQTQ